ncbi:hypothetical protein BH09CHL1_BH09CHL1_35340 [soil metagenome]
MYSIRYDQSLDALYIRFREGEIAETVEFREGIFVDLDASGNTLGLEALDAKSTGLLLAGIDVPDHVTEQDLIGAD